MLWKRSEDFRRIVDVALEHHSVNGGKVKKIGCNERGEGGKDTEKWMGIGIDALSDIVRY